MTGDNAHALLLAGLGHGNLARDAIVGERQQYFELRLSLAAPKPSSTKRQLHVLDDLAEPRLLA